MSDAGVKTTSLPQFSQVDDILGNLNGNTGQISSEALVSMLLAHVGPPYQTRSQLYADLAWPDGSVGVVFGDANSAYVGVYKKSGLTNSGTWSRIGDLPVNSATVAMLAKKADATAMQDALATKADATATQDALNTKAANLAGATAATFTVSESGNSRVIAWTGGYIRVGGVQVALADYSGTRANGEVLTIPNPSTTTPIPITKSTIASVSASVANSTKIVILRNTLGKLSEVMSAVTNLATLETSIATKADAATTQTALSGKMDAVASKLVTDNLRDADHRDANAGYYGAIVDELGKVAFAVSESGNVKINGYEIFEIAQPVVWKLP